MVETACEDFCVVVSADDVEVYGEIDVVPGELTDTVDAAVVVEVSLLLDEVS